MRKQAVRIGIVTAAAAGALALASTGSAADSLRSSQGTSSDLRDCAAAAAAEGWSGTWTGIKVDEPVAAGLYGSITIWNRSGNRFDWSSTTPVQVVFVKAGPGANLYSYGAGSTGDTGLQSPKPDSISHALFCFRAGDPAPTGGVRGPNSSGRPPLNR